MQSTGASKERRARKKRQRLSCFECRKRKLYCDRNLPCQRCIKSGKAAECSYEVGARPPSTIEQEQNTKDRIRNLEAEVADLKRLLSGLRSTTPKNGDPNLRHVVSDVTTLQPGPLELSLKAPQVRPKDSKDSTTAGSIDDPQLTSASPMRDQSEVGRETGTAVQAEISDPRMRETAREWFEPLGVQLVKKPWTEQASGMATSSQHTKSLENLLPAREDIDTLVFFYLDRVEQIHRIVHIPTFRREYDRFWEAGRSRCPEMTVLILSMASISICLGARSSGGTSNQTQYRGSPAHWISACEDWLRQRSPKHRRLVHYQIACLLYLAKRVNIIRKKTWWKETGSLVQDAIMDGFHLESASTAGRPYTREMRRRIWTTIRELDLQNAFEFGLPTLFNSIESDVAAPSNINDESLDDGSGRLPMPQHLLEYTSVSYQVHSCRSWPLRLEISRRLFSTEVSKPLLYDEVLRYTHELMQEITAIPSWEGAESPPRDGSECSAVSHAFLHHQLQVCILALHRPFLQRNDGRYWLSENVYYHTSRDMLIMDRKLMSLGLQSLAAIREDVFLASLGLARVTMIQPKDSTSARMIDSQSTISLLEQCLPFEEERYLRCFSEEPWCFLTMCGAIMMAKIHLAHESRQTAKASCARKFLDLYYKHTGRQQTSIQAQQRWTAWDNQSHLDRNSLSTTAWPDCSFSELGFEDFGPDVSLDGVWENWDSLVQTDPQTQSVGLWTNA